MKTGSAKIVVMACVLAMCSAANAALQISGSVGGAPIGVNRVNFDGLTSGSSQTAVVNSDLTVSFSIDGMAIQGTGTHWAAPYLSGNNGAGFGSPDQANGEDQTVYLTSGISNNQTQGKAVLSFNSPMQYLGLLWGSVDNYNTLSFYDNNNLVGQVTGSQVVASPNGDRGVNGTLYVNINSTLGFNRVEATSTQYAFEFDNVAYSTTPIPEPSTIIAGALLLVPLGLQGIRHLRSRKS